jgi:hypothetical protein
MPFAEVARGFKVLLWAQSDRRKAMRTLDFLANVSGGKLDVPAAAGAGHFEEVRVQLFLPPQPQKRSVAYHKQPSEDSVRQKAGALCGNAKGLGKSAKIARQASAAVQVNAKLVRQGIGGQPRQASHLPTWLVVNQTQHCCAKGNDSQEPEYMPCRNVENRVAQQDQVADSSPVDHKQSSRRSQQDGTSGICDEL